MPATNPFRVSDLVAKYGWKAIIYLSNLGPRLLSEAQVLFVDSGHTNASDVDDTEHGHSFEKPLATIDYAIGLCTAGERSVILAAPGHVDTIVNAQVDFDVSDITCIGIGEGDNKAAVNFGHANSSVDIGANNIHLINLRFVPSITAVLIGVDIETGVTGTKLEDCDFAEGDAAADEFIAGIEVKSGCDNTKIKGCLGRTKVASAEAVAAVYFNGASDNCIVEKCRFIGNYSTAAIVNDTAACTDLLIDDLTCKVKDNEPGIEVHADCTGIIRNACIESTGLAVDSMIVAAKMSWFNNYGVTADGTAGAIVGGGEVGAALDTAISSTPTGSSLNDILHKDGSYTFDNTTDSLEAIADAVSGISSPTDVTNAVPEPPTAKSLQDTLHKDGSYTYSKTTDSLEAIADALSAGTGATTAIEADLLHFLASAADGGGNAYPDSVVSDSVFAYLMAKGNPAAITSFDNATDSLEAISDLLRTGSTVLAGTQLDHLVGTTTGVAADANLDTYAVDQSVLSHIMSATANTSTYQCSTDSLEAIAVALAAGTGVQTVLDTNNLDHLAKVTTGINLDGDLSAHVITKSILAHIMAADADVTTSYNASTDSLEAISVALAAGTGATTALVGAQLDTLAGTDTTVAADNDLEAHCVAGSLLSHICSVGADITTFKPTTDSLEAIGTVANMGLQTVKVTGTVLSTGDKNVFTVAGGPVKITSLFFIIDTATNAACKAGFTCTPTAGAETDLTPSDGSGVEINAVDVGDIIYSEMDNTIMIIADTDGGAMPKVPEFSQIVPIGIITLALENSTPTTGVADIYVQWAPLAPGATLTAT
ncbi:hypothetical protein LCGC14_0681470 [marine sediment metagenome]|uniref:Right handed beta helix domain-containing protein n=1 Tax=marine sediment metagenome TaxID=412755 RepID=A0A0F9R8B6_9ZZZZ